MQHKLECQYYEKRRNQSATPNIAASVEEDATPLLLRTFAALKHLQTNLVTQCQQSDEIITCGSTHFSTLAVSSEYHRPLDLGQKNSFQNNPPLKLAKECMVSFATSKDARGQPDDITASIWGYNDHKSNASQENIFNLDTSMRRALNAFRKNNFGIVDSLHASIGEGVYPCAALLNHSCHPNCILRYEFGVPYQNNNTSYYPPILSIVACRNIKRGEELTHSYVDLALPTSERQSRLFETHGFKCNCTRCNNKYTFKLPANIEWGLWPLEQKIASLDSVTSIPISKETTLVDVCLDDVLLGQRNIENSDHYNRLIQNSECAQEQARNCMIEGDSAGELSYLKKAIEFFRSTRLEISPFNVKLYSIRCSCLSALLAEGDILSAVEQCEHIVSFLVVSLSHVQNHPLLGLQLFTLGDLYLAASDLVSNASSYRRKGLSVYAWARDVMLVTHGPNHSMVKLLEENIRSISQ